MRKHKGWHGSIGTPKNTEENSVFFGVFWKLLPTLIVLAALGLGLFLRYYRLASIPPLLW